MRPALRRGTSWLRCGSTTPSWANERTGRPARTHVPSVFSSDHFSVHWSTSAEQSCSGGSALVRGLHAFRTELGTPAVGSLDVVTLCLDSTAGSGGRVLAGNVVGGNVVGGSVVGGSVVSGSVVGGNVVGRIVVGGAVVVSCVARAVAKHRPFPQAMPQEGKEWQTASTTYVWYWSSKPGGPATQHPCSSLRLLGRPQGQVVPEQLHDQHGILMGIFRHVIQLGDRVLTATFMFRRACDSSSNACRAILES